jgi:hypothetical protein
MSISPDQYRLMLQRLAPQTRMPRSEADAEREVGRGGLVEQISEHCQAQWPKWVMDYGRTDKKSTREIGAHDATIWLPSGKVLCLELKAKNRKRSPAQLAWALKMEMLGTVVHECRSLERFIALAKAEMEQ